MRSRSKRRLTDDQCLYIRDLFRVLTNRELTAPQKLTGDQVRDWLGHGFNVAPATIRDVIDEEVLRRRAGRNPPLPQSRETLAANSQRRSIVTGSDARANDETNLQTVAAFAAAGPFTEYELRWWIFQAASNGLADAGAIVRVQRRVYVDVDKFEPVDRHPKSTGAGCRMTAPLEGESSAADVVAIVMVSGDGRRQLVGRCLRATAEINVAAYARMGVDAEIATDVDSAVQLGAEIP